MPAKYYSSGKKKSGKVKTQQRQAAFAKPGTGQFAAGALTEKGRSGRRDNQTVAPSVDSRFVTLPSGKTGTRVDVIPKYEPVIEQSQLFAAKLAEAQSATPNRTLSPAGLDFNNPQNAGVFDIRNAQTALPTPPPFVPNAAQDARGYDALAPYGRSATTGRPFTQEESGSASIITAEDLFTVMPSSFGAGISTTAFKGLAPKAEAALVGTVAKNGITPKAATLLKEAIGKELGAYWQFAKTHPLSMGAAVITAVVGGAFAVFKASISGKQFGQFLTEEGTGASGFVGNIALQNNRPDLAMELLKLQEQGYLAVGNVSNVPYKGTAEGFKNYAEQGLAANKVMQAVVQDRIDNPKEDYAAQRERIFAQEMAQKREALDHYNSEKERIFAAETEVKRQLNEEFNTAKLQTEQQILAARASSNKAERAARRRQLEEEAAFWAEQKELMFKLEAEERERQAAFWLEYKKMVLLLEQKAREEQGSSTLHFGLLR